MEIHHGQLTDVSRYIEAHRHIRLEEKEQAFRNLLRYIESVKPVGPDTKILEIGTGTGWFPTLCKLNGLSCKGLEISPALVEFAREMGRSYGIDPDVALGNLEDTDLGRAAYDVIVASSLFEHVEFWRKGLDRVYEALAPGGVLFFESTNKFSLKSGEWPAFPLYGWLPDALRYRLRMLVHGPDIMRHGIDFHQFTYRQLRRAFRDVGFTRILDRIEVADPNAMRSPWKRRVVALGKRSAAFRHLLLCFFESTTFVCVK